MSIKLTGNELYKLYKFDDERVYIFIYKKKNKGFHPFYDGCLAIRAAKGITEIRWFAVSDSTTYGWDEVDTIDSKNSRAMIKTMFEKNLNPSLKEVLY